MKARELNALRSELEELYSRLNKKEFLVWDPLGQVDERLAPEDFEIASLLAAGLAYGRVEQAKKSYRELLRAISKMGPSPQGEGLSAFIQNDFDRRLMTSKLRTWKHRLNVGSDVSELFQSLSSVLNKHRSLCAAYQSIEATNKKDRLSDFAQLLAPKRNSRKKGTGASWFAASPARGSTCKRFLLWLKWMIRKDEIDTGLWKSSRLVSKKLRAPSEADLFIPVDTHIYKWALEKGVTIRKSLNWQVTEELTDFFNALNPGDPCRYDFALCHEGILRFRAKGNSRENELNQ